MSVTFTADLVGLSPTGTVAFLAGATTICPSAAVVTTGATGRATCATNALPVGDHTVTAFYSGDADDAATSSAPLAFWVATSCRNGGSPSMTMPLVTWLRSYGPAMLAPSRLAVDPTGAVLVADPAARAVVVRAANGAILGWASGLGLPVSVGAGAAGRRYVGDAADGSVTAYDGLWNPLFRFGAGAGEFGLPGDIAVDVTNGEVFVVDTERHDVRVFDGATGAGLRSLGRFGRADGQFITPTGVAIDGTELLVADQMNYRIQALDKTTGDFRYCLGTYSQSGFISGGGGPARTYGMVQGLGTDADGRLYVADAFHGRINVIERATGAFLGGIGSFGDGREQLRAPTDLAIDANGRLFVASAGNARLEVWGLGSYVDPESVTPAAITLHPASLDRIAPPPVAQVRLELPNERLADLDPATVRINGLAPAALAAGDTNLNGQPDLPFELDPLALIATLDPAGRPIVTLTGRVNGLDFSASANLVVTAAPVATTTALDGPAGPIAAGAAVTLTSTVTGRSPSGTVAIRNGTTLVCDTGTLSAGTASCVGVVLPAGVNSLVAEYAGDANNAPSASAPFELTVDPATSVVSLSSSANPSTAGAPVVLTATIDGASPTGTVDLLDGTDLLCSSTGTSPISPSAATATCTIKFLAVGTHTVTASYSGDVRNTAGVSAPLAQLVGRAASGITLTSSSNPSKTKRPVTFTAMVTGLDPTGTVIFMDGPSTVCRDVALGNPAFAPGTATCETSALHKGEHSIIAVYSGDAVNAPATSASLVQSVLPPGQVHVTDTPPANSGSDGQSQNSDSAAGGGGDDPQEPNAQLSDTSTPIPAVHEAALALLALLLAGLGMTALGGARRRARGDGIEP